MAKVQFFKSPVALSIADFYAMDDDLVPSFADDTTFVVGGARGDHLKFVYTGEDFAYGPNSVVGGELELLQVFYSKNGDGRFVEIQRTSDISVDFAKFVSTSEIADPDKAAAEATRLLFSGDDTVTGSASADIFTATIGDDTVRGNGGNDTIIAGGGDDVVSGGLGKDVLQGDAGRDLFVFDAKLGKANVDQIVDFTPKDDTIGLDDRIFKQAGLSGDLTKAEFYVGAAAHDEDDRIVYDKATGKLFYDADGDGAAKAVLFAELDAGLKLTFKDFDIV